jgi:hypothetical protein
LVLHRTNLFLFLFLLLKRTMKKHLALLAVCFSLSAHADWRLIHTDASNSQYFIDQTNIALIDGYQRVWVLNNLDKANTHGTRSFRSVEEYDCINKQARVMQIAAFSGPMGEGDLLGRRHGNGQWVSPEEGSVDKMILNEACQSTK